MVRGLYCTASYCFPGVLEGGGNNQHWQAGVVLSGLSQPFAWSCLSLSSSVSPVLDPGALLAVCTVSSECAQVPSWPCPLLAICSDRSPFGFRRDQQQLGLFRPPPFWAFTSPEGKRGSSPGEHKEEQELKRQQRVREKKAGKNEMSGRLQTWEASKPTNEQTEDLHRLEVTSPVDRVSSASIHLTSWPCFLFPSALPVPVLSPPLFFNPLSFLWQISGHLLIPCSSFDLVLLCSVHLALSGFLLLLLHSYGSRGIQGFIGIQVLYFLKIHCHPGKLKLSTPKHGIREVFLSILCKNISDVFFCDLILRHRWTVSAEFSREFQPQAYIWPGKFQPKYLKFGEVYTHLKIVFIMERKCQTILAVIICIVHGTI